MQLVLGAAAPPCRISIIRTAVHPRFAGEVVCVDPDCSNPDHCMGNHWSIHECTPGSEAIEDGEDAWDYAECEEAHARGEGGDLAQDIPAPDTRKIKLSAPHHKNDHRGFDPISFTYQSGILSELMCAHIEEGHGILSKHKQTEGPQARDIDIAAAPCCCPRFSDALNALHYASRSCYS